MTRVYWDTMVFSYWLESHPQFGPRVMSIRTTMQNRGDRLCASAWTLCELLVFAVRRADHALETQWRREFESPALEQLPLSLQVAPKFAEIRAAFPVAPADALHLAIAATAGVNLFLTHDLRLQRLKISGIDFIAGLDTNLY